MRAAAVVLLLLTGCATSNVCVDRGVVGLMYSDLARPIYAACASGRLDASECAQYEEANRVVRGAIIQPKRDFDWERFLQIMGAVAKVAMKAAI